MSASDQLPFAFRHDARSGVEDFMPAPSNRTALAWIERWPDWPAPALILHGPPGAGKSHLAAIWAARCHGLHLGPELGDVLELDAARCYLLDPAEPIADEVKLLQLYNRLREDGGSMLLTATRPVAQWTIALPDLRSRLAAAPSVAIEAPDDQLLAALLLKLFDDRQLAVPEPVIRYLLTHMERSFAAARAVVEALDRLSLARQRPITIPLARLALPAADEVEVEDESDNED
ncbi:MAG: DnaA/Hda family protein [Alphaproteobacteria bacterium]